MACLLRDSKQVRRHTTPTASVDMERLRKHAPGNTHQERVTLPPRVEPQAAPEKVKAIRRKGTLILAKVR